MPVITQPNLIELSDFSNGWMPDQEPAALPVTGLSVARNLLPDEGTGALELRKGFKRITAALQRGYVIQTIRPYNRLAGDTTGRYLIVVMSNGVDDAVGNIIVYAHDLDAGTSEVISPHDSDGVTFPTKQWDSADGRHWGETIQETYYGGGPSDPMYSWNPDDGWNDDPSKPDEPLLVDSVNPAANELASDYAFKLGERVLFPDQTGSQTVPSFALKTAGDSGADATSYQTASITPGNNKLILVGVLAALTGQAAGVPSVSGCGLNFVHIGNVRFAGGNERHLHLFRAMKPAPSTGVLTITFGRQQNGCSWSVVEVSGMNTGGTNGSGAVPAANVQTAVSASATSLTVTLDPMMTNSATFGIFGRNVNDAMTPGSGFTELSDGGHSSPAARLQAIAKASADTSVDSSAASSAWAGIAIEVLPGGTGGNLLFEVDDLTGNAERPWRDIRFPVWKSGEEYDRQSLPVSRKATPAGEGTYWRSYRCILAHTADATNRPGDGSGAWQTYWRQLALPLPMDSDGNIAPEWNLVPTAPKTNVAMWHAERLWMRYDDVQFEMGLSRVIASAPSKFKTGSDISQLEWDPTHFGLGASRRDGDGAQTFDFRTGDGDDVVAMRSFGYYALFWKRHSTFVLSGSGLSSWTKRQLADVGCIGQRAHCELNGVVYFLGDQGFYVTDGSEVRPAGGEEKVREYLRAAVDWDNDPVDVVLTAFQGNVLISLPTGPGGNPDRTLVYVPGQESFYETDLDMQAVAINQRLGVDKLFFSQPVPTDAAYATATMAWTGTPHESTSTRTYNAATVTNLVTDPSFEPRRLTPFVSELNSFDWQTLAEVKQKTTWVRTDVAHVNIDRAVEAARRGLTGLVVHFDRDPYFFDAVPNRARPPLIPVAFEGVQMTFADTDTTQHVISVFIRRKEWKKNDRVDYTIARFRIGSSDLASGVHTYTKVGRGWYRMSATYTGSASARVHAVVIKPRATVHIDQAMVTKGSLVAYFDGDTTDDTTYTPSANGGGWAMVMEYDHPDVQETQFDDTGAQTYENKLIGWAMRTGWLSFGIHREERRIRRTWALIRGAVNAVLQGFRNYNDAVAEYTVEEYPEDAGPATYFEGRVMADSHAVALSVEGLGGPASVLGVAIDTEPRRVRYHS